MNRFGVHLLVCSVHAYISNGFQTQQLCIVAPHGNIFPIARILESPQIFPTSIHAESQVSEANFYIFFKAIISKTKCFFLPQSNRRGKNIKMPRNSRKMPRNPFQRETSAKIPTMRSRHNSTTNIGTLFFKKKYFEHTRDEIEANYTKKIFYIFLHYN